MTSASDLLLLHLDDLDDDLAEKSVLRVYQDEYLNKATHTGKLGVVRTHDEQEVVFFADRFKHAFFKSKNRILLPDDKSVFDRSRGERVKWIRRVISGEFEGVECWDCPGFGPKGPRRRLYVYWPERYVVWLVERKRGGFRFETAYAPPSEYIREKIKGCRKIKIPRD